MYFEIIFVAAAAIAVLLAGWIGHSYLRIWNDELEKERPKQTLTLSSADFRFRNGRNWKKGEIQFTAKQVLKHRVVIARNGLPGVQVCCARETAESDCRTVSRRHACLRFDFRKGQFYLENLKPDNMTRWCYLEEGGRMTPELVKQRLYLDRDMWVWFGNLPLEIRVSQGEPDDTGAVPNRAALLALTAFQAAGAAVLLFRYGVRAVPMWLTPVLLAAAAYVIFSGCGGCRPVCLVVMTFLTAAYFILAIVSKCPETMAENFLALLYPYGVIPLCLAKKWEKTEKNPSLLVKVAAAVALAMALHPSDVGETVSTAALLLLLFTDDSAVHEALTEIP